MLNQLRYMNYTVIDFETANNYANSACAIGLIRVENNCISKKYYSLIKPPSLFFSPYNIAVHGITAHDVQNEPTFEEIYHRFSPFLQDEMAVAHNAAFEMRVLKACLETYDIAPPRLQYFDSVIFARRCWPHLPNHKLNTVAEYHGFSFLHHNALEDAEVTAKFLIKKTLEENKTSISDLLADLKINIKKL